MSKETQLIADELAQKNLFYCTASRQLIFWNSFSLKFLCVPYIKGIKAYTIIHSYIVCTNCNTFIEQEVYSVQVTVAFSPL